MSDEWYALGVSGAKRFKEARKCLLPNESVQSACEVKQGFLVLSDRRIVVLYESKLMGYEIGHVVPYDCLVGFKQVKPDRKDLLGVALDQYGCHLPERRSLALRAPIVKRGENKTDVKKRFQSAVDRCSQAAGEIKLTQSIASEAPPPRSYSYLSDLPSSLTYNALLDLNAVLEDWPVYNELHQKTQKYLGDNPFLLEESLRDGSDKESGALFAAGHSGYIWVRGKKKGRFIKGVLADSVDWRNVRCFAYRWQNDRGIIDATYCLTKDGKESTVQYLWNPPFKGDVPKYPWLLQPLNGPWILADVAYKYSGHAIPASWTGSEESKKSASYHQRYYY